MWHLYSHCTALGESKPFALAARFTRAEHQCLAAEFAPLTYILEGL